MKRSDHRIREAGRSIISRVDTAWSPRGKASAGRTPSLGDVGPLLNAFIRLREPAPQHTHTHSIIYLNLLI